MKPLCLPALCAALLGAAPSGVLGAQLTTPTEWQWVLDTPATLVTGSDLPDTAWRFVAMPPGWHLTTGPGAFVYHPAYEGRGQFSVEAEAFLFPGTSSDGWGIFFGGRELGRVEDRSYAALLVRHDGAVRVVSQRGSATTTHRAWTPDSGVRMQRGDSTARNVVRADITRDSVAFSVNGRRVAAIDRAGFPTDGTLGFRVGRGVNLHVVRLDVTYRLAPVPRRKP